MPVSKGAALVVCMPWYATQYAESVLCASGLGPCGFVRGSCHACGADVGIHPDDVAAGPKAVVCMECLKARKRLSTGPLRFAMAGMSEYPKILRDFSSNEAVGFCSD